MQISELVEESAGIEEDSCRSIWICDCLAKEIYFILPLLQGKKRCNFVTVIAIIGIQVVWLGSKQRLVCSFLHNRVAFSDSLQGDQRWDCKKFASKVPAVLKRPSTFCCLFLQVFVECSVCSQWRWVSPNFFPKWAKSEEFRLQARKKVANFLATMKRQRLRNWSTWNLSRPAYHLFSNLFCLVQWKMTSPNELKDVFAAQIRKSILTLI